MSSASAGWYPQEDGRQRYWDGERWTEHFAPGVPTAAAPAPTAPTQAYSQSQAPAPAQPLAPGYAQTLSGGNATASPVAGDVRPWFKKKRFLIPGGLAAFVVMASALSGGDPDTDVASPPTSTPSAPVAVASAPPAKATPPAPAPSKPAPTPTIAAPVQEVDAGEYGRQPAAQLAVVQATLKAQAASEDAENDLARGAALRSRTTAICKAIPKRTATNWTGKVVTLDANGDGKGVLAIEIAPDVMVKTWNNSFSDITDETLIEPTDALFDKVLGLEEDQIVTFSGKFPADDANCIRENSLTLNGNVSTPGFILKFSDVK